MIKILLEFDNKTYIYEHINNKISERILKDILAIKENKYINSLEKPVTVGAHMASDFLIDNKKQLNDAMNKALDVYSEVSKEYFEATGRKYDLIEEYMTEDEYNKLIS